MADIIDQAQHYDEIYLQGAINAHFAAVSADTFQGSEYCVDCGDDIEPARRKAVPKATRCIDCQTKHERTYRRRL